MSLFYLGICYCQLIYENIQLLFRIIFEVRVQSNIIPLFKIILINLGYRRAYST